MERGFKYKWKNKQQHDDLQREFHLLWIQHHNRQPDNDQEN